MSNIWEKIPLTQNEVNEIRKALDLSKNEWKNLNDINWLIWFDYNWFIVSKEDVLIETNDKVDNYYEYQVVWNWLYQTFDLFGWLLHYLAENKDLLKNN